MTAMRVSRCLANPSSALSRAFVSQALSSPKPTWPLQRILLPIISPTFRQTQPFSNQYGPRGGSGRKGAPGSFGPKYETPAMRAKFGKMPRDGEIKSEYVLLREEDGALSEPQDPRDILADLDLSTHTLVTLAMPGQMRKKRSKAWEEVVDEEAQDAGIKDVEEENVRVKDEYEIMEKEDGVEEEVEDEMEEAHPGLEWPICRIVNKKKIYEEEMQKIKDAKKEASNLKEMEVSCAIAPNDLKTRLKQLRGFLEKGRKVQLTLMKKAKKREGREASKDERKEVLRQIEEAAAEVVGTSEYKAREGNLMAKELKIFFQGPQKKSKN